MLSIQQKYIVGRVLTNIYTCVITSIVKTQSVSITLRSPGAPLQLRPHLLCPGNQGLSTVQKAEVWAELPWAQAQEAQALDLC